jgi:thymidylate synthase
MNDMTPIDSLVHPEQQYLDLVRQVWEEGDERGDRTGVGTRSIFGATLRYSLHDDAVPLLTTKRVSWKTASREMLWFLSGSSNIRPLVQQGVHIWTDWPLDAYRKATGEAMSRDDFEQRVIDDVVFAERWGDLGPVYGVQWTRWPTYEPAGAGLYRPGEGVNQIAELIGGLKANPNSRRHIVTGWNVPELGSMALPPCHMTYQFYVSKGRLSCILYQRSADLGLGVPFNLFGAALLTRMVALHADLEVDELIWNGGDVHLYLNHADLVGELLSRTPAGAPKLRIGRRPETIFDHDIADFSVEDYVPQAGISAPVAV